MLGVVARNVFKHGAVTAGKMAHPAQVPTKAPLIMKSFLSYQNTLSKLPVPPLQQTLYKYLLAIRPLLSDDDYRHTKEIVDEFGKPGGKGEQLQVKLWQRAQKLDSWLSEWWLNAAYLDYRFPVVVHSSPGVAFPVQDFKNQHDQLSFAAKLIAGVLDYKVLIDKENIPIDMMGGQPLCMDQYYKILSSCRIPGPKRDSIVVYPGNKRDAPKHIIVMHNNHFFAVDVYYPSGKPLAVSELISQLQKVVDMSPKLGDAVGILTTEHRNTWGKVYKKLRKLDKTNKKTLEMIEKSIFLLSLDETISGPEERMSVIASQMLHGGGTHANSCNRWADKTLQFMVGRDGNCGVSYEHAPAEGPPVVSLLDHTMTFINNYSDAMKPVPVHLPDPKKLQFKLNNELYDDIDTAKRHLDSLVDDLQVHAFQFQPFGKNFPKQNKMSPDAFIQVALQLAYYRVYNEPAATYESGSIRRYRLGRTDTIRSCSIASDEFCKAMVNDGKMPSEKYRLLREAINAHRTYTNEAIFGDGIDRHLLGLKLTAIEDGQNVPELFMDPAYQTAMHFKLSTSQVPSKFDLLMCFGPVVPDGYGVCYNPRETHINIAISAFNSSPETDSKKLALSLAASLLEMQSLTVQCEGSKL
ncbi:carnitine O-acetyltransferase-like isoform X2 [Glandiceps talaboti]